MLTVLVYAGLTHKLLCFKEIHSLINVNEQCATIYVCVMSEKCVQKENAMLQLDQCKMYRKLLYFMKKLLQISGLCLTLIPSSSL